jgi:hypothetical protein
MARMPWALCGHPQRRSCFGTRHGHRPATDTPGPPLLGRLLPRRRQHGLRRAGLRGGSHPDPASGACDRAWPCTRPRRNDPWGPWRLGIRQPRRQRRPPLAGEPGPAWGPRWTGGRGRREGRGETPPRAHTGPGHGRALGTQRQPRPTPVSPPGALASWHPAPEEPSQRPGPCRPGLLAGAAWRLEARGGAQDRPHGPGPDTGSPGEGSQPPPREPAPAPAWATRGVGGPDGITGEAWGVARRAAAPLPGVRQAHAAAPCGEAHGHAAPAQPPAGGERRPDGPRPPPMIRLAGSRGTPSHPLAPRRHRVRPRREDGARHADVDMLPQGARQDRGKTPKGTGQGERQGAPRHPVGCRE